MGVCVQYKGIERAHERYEFCRLLGDGDVTKALEAGGQRPVSHRAVRVHKSS